MPPPVSHATITTTIAKTGIDERPCRGTGASGRRLLRRRPTANDVSCELPDFGLDRGDERAVADRVGDRLDVAGERTVVAQPRRQRAHERARGAHAGARARAAQGTRRPARRRAARSRAPARSSRAPATPSAPRRSPSTRDPPGRRSSGSSRRSPDGTATLFSLTSAAATYCGIMKPELSPPSEVRNAGSPREGSG